MIKIILSRIGVGVLALMAGATFIYGLYLLGLFLDEHRDVVGKIVGVVLLLFLAYIFGLALLGSA